MYSIVATRGESFSLKFTKYCLASVLCPDTLGLPQMLQDFLATVMASTSKGMGKEER